MKSKAGWIWMPHPGHFICARDCKFHLNTYIKGNIISTVGELWPDREFRRIIAESRKIKIEGQGPNDGRFFERKKWAAHSHEELLKLVYTLTKQEPPK